MTTLVHWIGGIRTRRTKLLAGWPACCSGDRCRAIAADLAACTRDPTLVTCKACLGWLARELADAAPSPPRPGQSAQAHVRHEVVTDHLAGRALVGTGARRPTPPRRPRKARP
jgi:hypothetical protein